MEWTATGRKLWEEAYDALTGDRPGLYGAITSRSEAHVLRLSMLYAILDRSTEIGDTHILAALALWEYCDRSAAHLFGDSTGDRNADAILAALRAKPEGMNRSEIRRGVFGDNRSAREVAQALGVLEQYRLAECTHIQTGGRTAERWFAVGQRGNVKDVKSVKSPPESPPLSRISRISRITSPAESEQPPDREVLEL
jgi:hypothetical protein